MRILYSFPRIVGRAGVGTTALQQITGLIGQGHEVVVYAKEYSAPVTGVLSVNRTVPGRRSSPIRMLTKGREGDWHDLRVAAAVRRRQLSLDAVYTWPGASMRTLVEAKRVGVKSFLEIPHAHIEYQYSNRIRRAAELGMRLEERHLSGLSEDLRGRFKAEYAHADYLMVPSDFVRTTFLAENHSNDQLLLHRYGFDPERFPEPGRDRGSTTPTVLFLGRCEPLKGLHVALRAWQEINAGERARLLIAGRFDTDYFEYLREALSDPSIEVMPFTEDPGALMRASDIFVAPSFEEGSALVCYEAQASGCAVLASDACGARLGPVAESLVHPAGDWSALAASLDALLDDPGRVREMRSEALDRRPCLTWDAAARQLSEILMSRV